MNAKPIFLYTPQASMTPAVLKRIERAGYLPVAVDSFDAVRVLDPVPLASLDLISKAAFDTIEATAYDVVPEKFGRRVAKALGTQRQDIPKA